MSNLKLWFDYNKLLLNLTKTKCMLFGQCKRDTEACISIEGVNIEKVSEIKFLGVLIDDKISWKPHIKYIQGKISRSISVINKAKMSLDFESLYILYCSLVLPYLTYCVEVWGNNYKCSLHTITVTQKRAIRIIHKVGHMEHTHSLFSRSKILKFVDIVQYQTAQLMFKAKNNKLPKNIQQLFKLEDVQYNLRRTLNFKRNRNRTTMRGFCVSVCGAKMWNALSVKLKTCNSMHQFKSTFKRTIFHSYENENML